MVTCVGLVFAALVAYATLLYKMFWSKNKVKCADSNKRRRPKMREASYYDGWFLVMFPLTFLFFNFVYWIHYWVLNENHENF